MTDDIIDEILALQLTAARLGERELKGWWNSDIAHHLGGADFLTRLVGPVMAPLAAAEGLLEVGRLKDESLLAGISGMVGRSLFYPSKDLVVALRDRMRHFKAYPQEVPPNIRTLIDSKKEWTVQELEALLPSPDQGAFTGTGFGRELSGGASMEEPQRSRLLAAEAGRSEKGRYVLAYYRESHGS